MKIKIDADFQEAFRKLKSYPESKQMAVKRIVQETAVSIEGSAIARTPVDTGNLKNSWVNKTLDDGFAAEISNTADYAMHVEMGTKKMSARPMLNPAVEEHRGRYLADLKKELGDAK